MSDLGPLSMPGRLRRLGPFAVVVAGVVIAGAFDTDADRLVFAVVSVLGVTVMAAAMLLPWHRLHRRAQGALILAPLFLIAALMRADGGLNSHVLVVMLVPLIWLAVYESRRCLFVGLACAGALLGAEIALVQSEDGRMRGLMVVLVALALLPPIRRLVTSNRAALAALAAVADLDALTGLQNRRGLERGLGAPERDLAQGLGMIFVDLNKFKDVNDTFGHDAGDDLLVRVGRRLAAVTRSEDLVARIGGDEFVLATNTDRAGVAALADRARDAISSQPFELGDVSVALSASVGFSHVEHHADVTFDSAALLHQADHAMYLAKRSGETRTR